MIIRDDKKLIFVHIPKNGGVSIRNALGGSREFWQAGDVPGLGRRDLAHLSLEELRSYLPNIWAKMQTYETFAVLRDPEPRFISSVFQHMKDHYGIPKADVDQSLFTEYARRASEALPSDEYEYAHFRKQVDFIRLGDNKIVSKLFIIDQMDKVQTYLSRKLGEPIKLAVAHKRPGRVPPIVKIGWSAFKMVFPNAYSWKLKQQLVTHLPDNPISLSPELREFVAKYYKEDKELYDAVGQSLAIANEPPQLASR